MRTATGALRGLCLCVLLSAAVLHAPAGAARASDSDWRIGRWATACRYDVGLLPELSGLTHSLRHKHILWAINDSGNDPILYALDTRTCAIRGRHRLQRTTVDPESLTTSRDRKGRAVLWVGDIGDNPGIRRNVRIFKLREPGLGRTKSAGRRISVTYPDRPHDAESLLASRRGRWLYIGTKQVVGSTMYRIPTSPASSTATPIGRIPDVATDAARNWVTGQYAIRDYSRIHRYLWPVLDLRPLGSSPAGGQTQAEALSFSRNGRWLYTASERDPRLLRARVKN